RTLDGREIPAETQMRCVPGVGQSVRSSRQWFRGPRKTIVGLRMEAKKYTAPWIGDRPGLALRGHTTGLGVSFCNFIETNSARTPPRFTHSRPPRRAHRDMKAKSPSRQKQLGWGNRPAKNYFTMLRAGEMGYHPLVLRGQEKEIPLEQFSLR